MMNNGNRLYVGGLGEDLTSEDVKSRFSTFGPIKQCWFQNLHKGFAFIEFHKHDDALRALQAKNVLFIKGVKAKIDWAKPQTSQSNSNDKENNHKFTYNGEKEKSIKSTQKPNEIVKVNYPKHWPIIENSTWRKIPIKGLGTIRNFLTSINDSNIEVLKVEEICNKEFYHKYETQKAFMKNKSKVNEKLLYHGTTPDIVDAICAQNFDFRLCGKNATVYGKGSYFSSSAEYSHRYTSSNSNGVHFMFLAKVLVGNSTVGKSTYTRPPELPSSDQHELYDSCVDDVKNPTIFVVFERDQCYPKYLISYKVTQCCGHKPPFSSNSSQASKSQTVPTYSTRAATSTGTANINKSLPNNKQRTKTNSSNSNKSLNNGYSSSNAGYSTLANSKSHNLSTTRSLLNALNSSQTSHNTGHTSANTGHTSANTGYTSPNTGYTSPNTGYTSPNTGYTSPNTGYTSPNTGYTSPNTGYTPSNTGYTSPKTSYTSSYTASSVSNSSLDTGYSSVNAGTILSNTAGQLSLNVHGYDHDYRYGYDSSLNSRKKKKKNSCILL